MNESLFITVQIPHPENPKLLLCDTEGRSPSMFHEHGHGTTEDTARLIGQKVGNILYLSVNERIASTYPNEIVYRVNSPMLDKVILDEDSIYAWRDPLEFSR